MAEVETETETETETGGLTNNKATEEHASPIICSTASLVASAQEPDIVPSFAVATTSTAPGLPRAQVSQSSLPPLVIGWQNTFPHASTTNVDSTRVTQLEARMAQLEARLAGQDVLVLQLQRALLNQNA